MAKGTLIPIQKVSQITPEYIRDSIKNWYNPELTDQMTDLFLNTLAFDYKRKAENLRWLFGDDTTITITANAEDVLKSLRANKAYGLNEVLKYLEGVGATYTADLLAEKKCIFKKQEMRISRVISSTLESCGGVTAILTDQKFALKSKKPLTTDKRLGGILSDNGFQSITSVNRSASSKDTFTDGISLWVNNANSFLECYDIDNFDIQVRSAILEYNIDDIFGQIQGGSIVLSMDLNDMITCSNGGVSSCMGFSGSYHQGWMMTFRSDFGVIAYMKNDKDRFHKLGRQWLHLRMTKDGKLFDRPGIKFMQNYGNIGKQHVDLVANHLFKVIEEKFNIKASSFKKEVSGSFGGTMVSMNMGSNARSGYLDSATGDNCPAYGLLPDTLFPGQRYAFPEFREGSSVFEQSDTVLFNFPDALSLNGIATNGGQFTTKSRKSNRPNYSETGQYKEVLCDVTKNKVLDVECTFIPNTNGVGGKYIQTKLLLAAFDPELIPKEPEKEVVETPETPVFTADFDDDDFDDDNF